MAFAIGVDIGGTFTDCVAVDGDGTVFHGKAPSTHATSPVDGVLDGLDRLAEAAGVTRDALLAEASRLSHGTTIGTNLVVERAGARVGLLATRGHGDALTMMRGNGRTAGAANDEVYSVHQTDKPAPLVPRALVVEVPERVAADGTVLAPLDEDAARAAVASLLDRDVDAIAVALLWSFRNPAHERRLRELVTELAPAAFVSLSSDTAPRQGEYERTVAAVVNSYVGPASSAYLRALADTLASHGLERPVFIMQANGGVVGVDTAAALPIQTIGSGPAGGLAGTSSIAAASGHANVIATDMGGTSFEVGLVVDGRAVLSGEQVLDHYTFHAQQLDVRSIACGGGSIARVDRLSKSLRVGPESAGGDPGPACYGRGSEPTVTDADVVLGLLDPEAFLGGAMALDRDAALRAVKTVADDLGLSVEDAAAGIVRVNAHAAATLIRQRTLEQGLDPREFVLYAFGGAGPVHAFAYAAELGVREVVIPMGNGASTLSAYGIAASDVTRTFEQECSVLAPFDVDALANVVAAVEERALAAMADAGFARDEVVLERTAMARYAEQFMQALALVLPETVDASATADLHARFEAEYTRLYGAAAVAVFQAVELFAIRVTARVALGVAPPRAGADDEPVAPAATRSVHWPGDGPLDTPVYDRVPARGQTVVGPAVIGLAHTTVAVARGQRLRGDDAGNLVLTAEG